MRRLSNYNNIQISENGISELMLRANGVDLSLVPMLEAFTLEDFGQNAVSDLTGFYFNKRMTDPDLDKGVRLIEAQWDESAGNVTMFFEVEPTHGTPAKVVTPTGRTYQGTFYNVVIQLLDVQKYIGNTKADLQALAPEQQVNNVSSMIWHCYAKLYSNDCSFYFQGMWEDLDSIDAAVYRFPGPKGDGIWRAKHAAAGGLQIPEIRITKHLAQVLNELNGFIPSIRDFLIR